MRPELLAPARDADLGMLAINAGADAVYIGVEGFSARQNAGNPVGEIARLVQYARRYQARVYAALNILLLDREVPKAVALLHRLHEAGVDGAIIQDLGLLKAGLPPLPLIASTQTHNNTVERVRFLAALGFCRVTLARELSVEEMGQIRQGTDVPLEAFVHGALCMAYSGQCYLSYARGGRSANRGACAQPCRKEYHLIDGTGATGQRGHLLSMKDLNRLPLLGEMLDAGITSFKIEGRLKDAAYVATVVAAYRRALDAALKARGTPVSQDVYTIAFAPDPARVFHRGFTDGFATGEGTMATLGTPKAMGIPLGTVRRRDGNRVTLDRNAPVAAGDGLCFFDGDGTLSGARVESVHGAGIVLSGPKAPPPGTRLFRNRDHAHIKAVRKAPPLRQVPIAMILSEAGASLRLTVKDKTGSSAAVHLGGPFEAPRDPDGARQRWRAQLSKTGDTEFLCESLLLEATHLPFVTAARMNALRRAGLDALRHARMENAPRLAPGVPRSVPPPLSPRLGFASNVANRYARELHEDLGATDIIPAPEAGTPLAGERVMTSRYCLRRELNACLRTPEGAALQGPLGLLDPHTGDKLSLSFDCDACEMHVTLPAGRTDPGRS